MVGKDTREEGNPKISLCNEIRYVLDPGNVCLLQFSRALMYVV